MTIYIQHPAPTIEQFDSWLWRNQWIRTHTGAYVNIEGKDFKTVGELWKMFKEQTGKVG